MSNSFGVRPTIRHLAAALLAGGLLQASAGPAAGAVQFQRVTTLGVGSYPNFAAARTPDGVLHLLYQTTAPGSSAPDGLATATVSPSGALSAPTTALSGWGTSRPGLVSLANGTLEAVFGAIWPGTSVSTLWEIQSTDGGASWSVPVDVSSGSTLESLAYGADVTGQLVAGAPVWTLSVAGGVTVQQGLGAGSPTAVATDATDDFAGDVDSAIDAGTGQMVASWRSNAGNGGSFIRAVAPALGAVMQVPGQLRDEQVLAGRDSGAGVFTAYTTDGQRVSLLRYGGGSVSVGRVTGVSAKDMGVATGRGGRIWVMWGDENGGLVVTRSNRAVTRFEPLQRVNPHAFTLYRISGDGRLGPLDLFADEIPTVGGKLQPAGSFHARVLPELTASVRATASGHGRHALSVRVTDAGDAVAGAKVSVAGRSSTTGPSGTARLLLPATVLDPVTVAVRRAGYLSLRHRVAL